ncbi:hypothetical protein GCM10007385_28210 [Tateyamaria omphalii]|uniref:DUF6985 domain-containing protein n=1 Tax=Tateyamaria omphalii TaxID=299262 RepID=UPI001678422B|nr:hypothetical protein [Tateyamaria omphalii]GGX58025.1 hypothetical protein GCM10007385_28210 [Tateyamaria omphalii]
MSDTISLPFFGGASVALLSDVTQLPPAAGDALRRFSTLTPADRSSITQHVYAYYRDMHTHAGGNLIDEVMPRPNQPDDIWKHIHPLSIAIKSRPTLFSDTKAESPTFYVLLETNCDWEDEHGLLLSWKEGYELVKVGEYDDKPVHGSGVPAGVIYHSSYDESFSTFRSL